MQTCFRWLALIAAVVGPASAAGADDAGIDFFEKKVRPLLVQHCYECHSAEAKELGGSLLLDSREGVRKGGDSGAVVESGKPEDSLLIKAIRYADKDLKMPPKGKLPAAAIADLETWVKLGAPDPRDKPPKTRPTGSWEEILKSRRDWWSLQKVQKPAPPPVKDPQWSSDPVDCFILAGLQEQGLAPAAPADPRTLCRRLYLVLSGLPPIPEQVESFVKEYEAARAGGGGPLPAVERLVDSLLESPHFGERWARHWMDVVRFSETHGNEWNYEVHHAWRYRDYLIRAFNADLPYDQFVREHIAGDLLEHPRWNERERFNESVIGTAFYRFGEVNHDDCISIRQLGYDIADNQIDTLTKAFQATTVACARCHDHKLDAVSMHDYYALLGILRSSRLVSHTIDAPGVNDPHLARLRELKGEIRRELAAAWRSEAGQMPKYMLAAEAKRAKRTTADELAAGLDSQRLEKWMAVVNAEKTPLEDPFEPWRLLVAGTAADESSLAAQWRKVAQRYSQEDQARAEFSKQGFETYADFRTDAPGQWQVGGLGLRGPAHRGGDFAVNAGGEPFVSAVLPNGRFTHAVSERLNGTLRSPPLPIGKKHISFQVMGQRSSAVRLVSNNCQLNYKNYRALISGELHWVTFPLPEDQSSLRVYAELMTMLDNPKFPDQLSALGGDTANYRLPWEKAVENPRSYFGVTRVVLHDAPEPPKPDLSHFRAMFAGKEPATSSDVATRYAGLLESAATAWGEDKATDDEVRWLDACLRRGLLGNRPGLSPRLETLAAEFRRVEAELAEPRVVPGVADFGAGFEQPVFVRGDCTRPGEPVPRRYLEVLTKSREPLATGGSGRLELARQIASPENPLTPRVMVNRVWQHLFGSGLVRTVDDFGHVGDRPSHPELLDYLAARFVEEGWSIKRLIRSLVLTRTFALKSRPSTAAKEADPQNRLLHHYPARRLEAEAIRDAILAASGRLDRTLYGMSIQPYRETQIADRRLFPGPLDGHGRRSIYIKNNLMETPKFLGAFDFPGGKVAQGRRDVTNVPAQALALLNDPFVLAQARVWGERLVARRDDSIAARLQAMFETALNRPPSKEELDRFVEAAAQLAELHAVPPDDVLKTSAVWQDLAHAVFNLQEFIYIP